MREGETEREGGGGEIPVSREDPRSCPAVTWRTARSSDVYRGNVITVISIPATRLSIQIRLIADLKL